MSDPSIDVKTEPKVAVARHRSLLERGYRSILVHVQADAPGRLACARSLARRFGARVIGIGAEGIRPIVAGPASALAQAQWIEVTSEAIRRNLERARELFDAEADGARQVWEQEMEPPTNLIARTARAADLIVASRAPGPVSRFSDADPGDLALTAGRPVLFAPGGAGSLGAQRVLVAWKDCREARRALFDALPFLCGASEVLVLAANPEDPTQARHGIEDVATALTRRGVQATSRVASVHHPEGEEILRQAKGFGADLIVAGAYGAPRLTEWIFGGVTRDLLGQNEIHVLFSH
jgi:nucleotide-binding universal stress UspA family protein